jgi:hypothetical protein
VTDLNLQAAQFTIDSLNAQITELKQRRVLSLKAAVKQAIPGWNGKLGAHFMGWFGDGNTHRVNRYKSNDTAVVKSQLDAQQAVGIEFDILTWKGSGNFVDSTAAVLLAEIKRRGMLFAYLLDPWIAKNEPWDDKSKPSPQRTQKVIDQLTGAAAVLNDGCYMRSDGKPLVCEFSLSEIGVDLAKVRLAHPELNILSWHTGYSWPNIGTNGAGQLGTLKADHAKASMRIASVNPCFNDAGYPLTDGSRDYCHSVWSKTGPARAIDHQAGNWFLDQLATIPSSVPFVAVATWNDHDEGTGIEQFVSMLTGIRIGV